MIVLHSAAHVQ